MPFVSFETRAFTHKLDPAAVTPAVLLYEGGRKVGLEGAFRGPLIRRPYEGIALKERTPAHVTVVKADGDFVLLNNSLGDTQESAGYLTDPSVRHGGRERYWTDFTLLQVQESREEKFQLQETFGEDFVFFFGEKPRFLSCAGTLVNTLDFQWRTIFLENYDKSLRGTRCVENRARVHLSWDDVLVEGYMVRCSTVDHASEPHQIPFNFTMLLTGYWSLAAMNLSVLASWREAGIVDRPGEIAGSRQGEVLSGGEPVSLEPAFWQGQLQNIFGTSDPQEALAVALREPGTVLGNLQATAEGGEGTWIYGAKRGVPLKEALADPASAVGKAAPLLRMTSGWSPDGETVAGVSKYTLASRKAAVGIFGGDFKNTHSLSYLK